MSATNNHNVTTAATDARAAKNQTVLVYLLLLLHPLFGITALIGAIVAHMKTDVTRETVFESHRRWQLWTFWTGLIGYAAAFYYLLRMGSWTILLVTMIWLLYRIIFGWWRALNNQPVGHHVSPGDNDGSD
ncbi:MAG: hypothetical protein KTR33_02610 [Gammaproteobacteria bacterium]|nr:hypothetical protein [Gammaproteobacteria bacterium]